MIKLTKPLTKYEFRVETVLQPIRKNQQVDSASRKKESSKRET